MGILRKGLWVGSLAALAAGLLSFGWSRIPALQPAGPDAAKRLAGLKSQAAAIRAEFADVLSGLLRQPDRLPPPPYPRNPEGLHAILARLPLRPEIEGVAAYRTSGELLVWRGRVFDVAAPGDAPGRRIWLAETGASRLIVHKASSYLVLRKDLTAETCLVFYRLIAFQPQFKTSYLHDYLFLGPRLRENCDLDTYDYREDVSGFETIFGRNQDAYIGQPRPESDIQTLWLPLRNEQSRIVATVTLTSSSSARSSAAFRERLDLISTLFFLAALAGLLVALVLGPSFFRDRSPLRGGAAILIMAAGRLVLARLGGLSVFRSLAPFSPSPAGFASLGPLTRSPADIFLTALTVFAAVGCALFVFRPRTRPERSWTSGLTIPLLLLASGATWGLLLLGRSFVSRLVFHSNLNLLEFSLHPSFLLLHTALWLSLMSLVLAAIALVRFIARRARDARPLRIALLAVPVPAFGLGLRAAGLRLPGAALLSVLTIVVLGLAWKPDLARRIGVLAGSLAVVSAFLFAVLVQESRSRDRSLMEGLVKNVVMTQEHWAAFFAQESLPELDGRQRDIRTFLRRPEVPNFAHDLWEKTLLARFNWYSGIEVLGPDGLTLSSFALNIPMILGRDLPFPPSPAWRVVRHRVPYFGKVKEFLIGYRDWYEGETRLGRTLVIVLLDDELLPFLYSANPYFELLRLNPLPSLGDTEFAVVVYDLDGRVLFNPRRLSAGLPERARIALAAGGSPRWTVLADRSRTYDAHVFLHEDRLYALCLPRPGFISLVVAAIRLFLLSAALTALAALAIALGLGWLHPRNPFRSFSTRVFASFAVVAFVPLLLVSLFTRGFFDRIFSQFYLSKAETYAHTARSIMEDFLSLRTDEEGGPEALPEDMVYWIGATIGNDITLYRDGHVLASSRREFFDAGLLPDLVDGDVDFRLAYDRAPVATLRQKIGTYSFQNLTIPFSYRGSLLYLSLPFPFERQEVAQATRDFIESLFFITVFFTALALVSARTVGRMIVTPVRKLLDGTRQVGLGNLEVRIDHPSRDEMKTLIDGFNAMVRSLKSHQAELAEMSKKAAWAEMARKVAHEVKNPLTPIQLSAEHLIRVFEDKNPDFEKALRESVSYITSEVENLRRIARDFLESSRQAQVVREPFDVLEAARETLQPFREVLADRIAVREDVQGDGFRVRGDRVRFKLALRNLVINAIEAIPGPGTITLGLARAGRQILVRIEDDGPGMPPDVRERIFEPYFSTKETGTGLGLPLAKRIIEDQGGTIEVWSEPGRGTRIVLRLPELSD
jgi:signal transduction histidine kinase